MQVWYASNNTATGEYNDLGIFETDEHGRKKLFCRDHPTVREAQIMRLSRQALLSTAELIKCVETGTTDISTDSKLMDALYADNDTTSDNIRYLMQNVPSKESVTLAVANLYLRKQIIFERLEA